MPVDLFVLVPCCVAITTLSVLIFARSPSDPDKKRFLYLCIALVAWTVFNFLADNANGGLLLFNRLTFFGGVAAIYFMMSFIYHYPNDVRKNDIYYKIFNIYTIILLPIIFLPQFILSVGEKGSGLMETSFLYNLFIAYIAYSFVLLFIVLKKQYKRSESKPQKDQLVIISLGFIIYAILSVGSNVVLPLLVNNWTSSRFGPLSTLLFVGIIFYAIVKHHLFDIRLAIVRSVTYSMVLATFTAIYLIVAYAVSTIFNTGHTTISQDVSGILTSLLLALIFQPVKRFFDRVTNKVFYKDNYNIEDFIGRLNRILTITTDLRSLLERASYEIAKTMKGEQGFFFIYTGDDHYITAGTEKHKQLPRHDAEKLGELYKNNDRIIVASLLDPDDPIRRLMVSHRIELTLTLAHEDKIIGFLCLGEHLNSGYTSRDIRALNTISNELVIAIQNALAVNEVKELNATLQLKVANATKELRSSNAILRQLDKVKDEFISMASHQLRTPLTSVKGYISMVIEGDAGKISDSQKKLLNEAFMSSERMVHLINDFLNVSRIQSGKFIIDKTPVDLVKLVQEEIDGLKPNATARKMKFKYDHPKEFPQIYVDEGKMRQVVMNFADNAIYYSHDGSVIDIYLGLENNDIVFYVKDKGIGVPEKEKQHLFAKFYRAQNARVQRPDGTGVGIYLAKKVVDSHGGTIIFDSTEGKGSTFGFRLPLSTATIAPKPQLESEQVPQL